MAKTFRPWDPDQRFLIPPAVHEFVRPDHISHFVRDLVRDSLDLSEIFATYSEERGFPPYHPTMMTALLLYAYSQGIYSSRRIAQACEQRLDFMAVTAMARPDFRTVSEFRRRHLKALGGLFQQVLKLCAQAGLVKLGHVALDSTKIRANASKHKAMSYGRMKKEEAKLRAEVESWLKRAESADASEDRQFGAEKRGDELPEWVTDKQKRIAKIAEAKAALEAEARGDDDGDEPPKAPREKDQRNFTDPESRIMKTGGRNFEQSYNCQAAVDAKSHVIVAQMLTNNAADAMHFEPMVAQIKSNTGRQARELSADAGYISEGNVREAARRHIRAYIAVGRAKHGRPGEFTGRPPRPGSRVAGMAARLRRGGKRSRYRLRKVTVEPVFGIIKQARGFRQFLLRGIENVAGEWSLVCLAHNLHKLAAVTT
jgi:transposase